jgi:nucleoside-diphosphate-sugar epimerase
VLLDLMRHDAPMRTGRVVVFGASGVIGKAAVRHFAASGWDTIGVSRRDPGVGGAAHLALDLTDTAACGSVLSAIDGVTHVVYAAMVEAPGLITGWRDEALMATNLAMLRNAIDPILERRDALVHVSLLQGTKAYGVHVDRVPVPVKERWPRHPHPNFYFLHEDHLRERQVGAEWGLTILRPQVVYGDSLGSPMNLVPAIGAYGAIQRDRGLPLSFPGGTPHLAEAVDADLLAHVLAWAAVAPEARNETFNVANGDTFVWSYVWPAIADALGMEVGDPVPQRLAIEMPHHDERWADIVRRHQLAAPPSLRAFVGDSFTYADILFGYGVESPGLPTLTSTIKLRHAGFDECCDTEDMFRRWLHRLQDARLLPFPARG